MYFTHATAYCPSLEDKSVSKQIGYFLYRQHQKVAVGAFYPTPDLYGRLFLFYSFANLFSTYCIRNISILSSNLKGLPGISFVEYNSIQKIQDSIQLHSFWSCYSICHNPICKNQILISPVIHTLQLGIRKRPVKHQVICNCLSGMHLEEVVRTIGNHMLVYIYVHII